MANGAPIITKGDTTNHWRATPRWINPCGLNEAEIVMSNHHEEQEPQSEQALLMAAQRQVETALQTASHTMSEFVSHCWKGKTIENIHSFLQHNNYEWLPNLPKKWGENVSEEHLKSVKLNDTLVNMYTDLQKVAVGLEQTVIDMRVHGSCLIKDFEATEHQLTLVLCEIQTVLYNQGVSRNPDIQRDHMDDEFRDFNATERKKRDFIVLRDLVNTLEYAQQAFRHIAKDS